MHKYMYTTVKNLSIWIMENKAIKYTVTQNVKCISLLLVMWIDVSYADMCVEIL